MSHSAIRKRTGSAESISLSICARVMKTRRAVARSLWIDPKLMCTGSTPAISSPIASR